MTDTGENKILMPTVDRPQANGRFYVPKFENYQTEWLAYSRIGHIGEIVNRESSYELFGRSLNNVMVNIAEYQQHFVAYFMKNFLQPGAKVLEIRSNESEISRLAERNYDYWYLEDVQVLEKNDENSILSSLRCQSNQGRKISTTDSIFDFIFSVGDPFRNLCSNDSGHCSLNLQLNLTRLSKPGSYSVHCFKISRENGSIGLNNLLYGFYKKDRLPRINVTRYVKPHLAFEDASIYTEEQDMYDSGSQQQAGEISEPRKSQIFSYNTITQKTPVHLEANALLPPSHYRKISPAYFFHHIIKCGGSSLGVALMNWFDFRNDLYDDAADNPVFTGDLNLFLRYKYNLETISSDTCIRGHFQHNGIFLEQRYPEVFNRSDIRVFTFVRDPLSLLISLYYFGRKRMYDYGDATLESMLESTSNFLSKVIPCTRENYKEVLDRYYFIGIVERMQESFDLLAKLTGKKALEIGMYNTTTKDEQVSKLTDEFKEKIRALNELDYLIYDYCVEKFEKIKSLASS